MANKHHRVRRQPNGIAPVMTSEYLSPLEKCDMFVKECIEMEVQKEEAKQLWLAPHVKESVGVRKFQGALFRDVWANNGGNTKCQN